MEKMTRTVALDLAIVALADNAEAVEVLQKMKASIEKKAGTSKPTKVQIENETTKTAILDFLASVERATVKDIILGAAGCGEMSSQKITALVSALVKDNKVARVVEKKVAYFSLV